MTAASARALPLAALALLAAAVVPGRAPARSAYGGIGATIAAFDRTSRHRAGALPVGVADYRITSTRNGRVASYELRFNLRSARTDADLRRLIEKKLPADAKQVQRLHPAADPNWSCAIYRSRWLGRVLYGPYVVIFVSAANGRGESAVSTQPACRG